MLILGQKIIYVYRVSELIISGDLCMRLYIFIGVLKRGKSIILLEKGSFRVF